MRSEETGPEIEKLISAEPDELDRRAKTLRTEFERHPGWAEFLLPVLSQSKARVANARRLLAMFPRESMLTIARGFEIDDPNVRIQILGILWGYLVSATPRDRELLLAEVLPHLKRGFEDRRRPKREFEEGTEVEHDYRICDEVYVFLNYLRSKDFEDSYFELLPEDRQDAEISQFARRVDNLMGSPVVAARKAAGQPAALSELTIIANFPDAYSSPSTQQERDQAVAAQWAPADRDFTAVAIVDTPEPAKAIFRVSSFLEAIAAIVFVNPSKPDTSDFRPVQSIKRVNIISHGNPGLIAMSGTVDTSGGVLLGLRAAGADMLSGPIDVDAVQAAANPNLQLANGKALALSLRDRLTADAEIFLLACKTGMGGSLLLMEELKKLFKVKIRAYSQEIAFCPQLDATKITDRAFTAVGSCTSSPKRGFRHLTFDRTF